MVSIIVFLRENGSQSKSQTLHIKESGSIQRLTILDILLMSTCTDTQILEPLDLTCGRSVFEIGLFHCSKNRTIFIDYIGCNDC